MLQCQTPLHLFTQIFSHIRVTTDLPVKVFKVYCFCYPKHTKSKLDPRAHKYVFTRYAPNKRIYKYYDVSSKKILVSMDVTFSESQPFVIAHLQGEAPTWRWEDLIFFISVSQSVFPVNQTKYNAENEDGKQHKIHRIKEIKAYQRINHLQKHGPTCVIIQQPQKC